MIWNDCTEVSTGWNALVFYLDGNVRSCSSASGSARSRCLEHDTPHAHQGKLEVLLEQQQTLTITNINGGARETRTMDEDEVHCSWLCQVMRQFGGW